MPKRPKSINAILRDPHTSKWLKQAITSALDCDPYDVMRDVETLRLVMQRYVPLFDFLPPSKQWPEKPKSLHNVIQLKRVRVIRSDR